MSLIGSLEDLSLGDILQIISLSQKSGVLVLRTEDGEGRITFRSGLVSGAVEKNGPQDLRGVLVGGGFVEGADFDAVAEAAKSAGAALEEHLVLAGLTSAERLDSLRREAVEAAVVQMFRWGAGEFSFDVREDSEPEDPQLVLSVGLNAQYLAMEGARCGDEQTRDEPTSEPEEPELSAHEMFGVEPEAPPETTEDLGGEPEELLEAVLEPSIEPEPDATGSDATGSELADEIVAASAQDIAVAAVLRDEAPSEIDSQASESAPSASSDFDRDRPVVVIDAELAVLEWAKQALSPLFGRVHIFQRSDLGLARIRQYLARAVNPIVVMSPDTPGDRLSGIADAADFVRRLRLQAPRISVLWLREDPEDLADTADAAVTRPTARELKFKSGKARVAALGEALCEALQRVSVGATPAGPPQAEAGSSPAAIERLNDATGLLRDASGKGEVFPVVIEFAARSFERVVMFAVREGVARPIAGNGLARTAGPPVEVLRELRFEIAESSWLCEAVNERRPVLAAPRNAGDEALISGLGDRRPERAYLAPIECGGRVVAVLFADSDMGQDAPIDTSALQVVLHHAGLALDRAGLG